MIATDNGVNGPKELLHNANLCNKMFTDMTDEDKMVLLGGGLYDDESIVDGVRCFQGGNVLLPECFPQHISSWSFGHSDRGDGSFPLIGDVRTEAWAAIVDCGHDHFKDLPRKLEDAWDQSKRSRALRPPTTLCGAHCCGECERSAV